MAHSRDMCGAPVFQDLEAIFSKSLDSLTKLHEQLCAELTQVLRASTLADRKVCIDLHALGVGRGRGSAWCIGSPNVRGCGGCSSVHPKDRPVLHIRIGLCSQLRGLVQTT